MNPIVFSLDLDSCIQSNYGELLILLASEKYCVNIKCCTLFLS